jgi:two-component system C4-dicarboxylate transport sensor histidine kinase DctB
MKRSGETIALFLRNWNWRTTMALTLASTNLAGGPTVPARLAHDIRNTLATIALHLDTLERLAGASGAKAASAAHALVAKSGGMCTEVLQEASHPDLPTRRTGFDVVATIRQVIEMLAPIAPESLALRIVGDSPMMALGNAQETFRILYNLAHNAVMVARRTRRMSELVFTVERTAATIVVRIADDGPGLPKAVRSHLFSHPAARFATTGNGYGLAIARELAERNGGMLELASGNTGTAFVLTLAGLAMTRVSSSPVTRLLGRQAMRL